MAKMAKGNTVKKHLGLVLGHLERISNAVFAKYKQVITELECSEGLGSLTKRS